MQILTRFRTMKTMMTVNDLFRYGFKKLSESEIEDPEFDARCLVEYCLGFNTSEFFIKRNELITSDKEEEYRGLIARRCNREPLQYIIGKWEFYSNEFYVGEGVLVPRPETEMIIDEVKKLLIKKPRATVVDFCSGSGCIAITIAKLFPDVKVYAVEKYDEAYGYILRNIHLNHVTNVIAIKGDVFDTKVLGDIKPDLIVSNPPYIRSEDICTLDAEVLNEPHTALDGGVDGLEFYRILADYWFTLYLNEDTAMILECAEDQAAEIVELISANAKKTEILLDFNGLQRVVKAFK